MTGRGNVQLQVVDRPQRVFGQHEAGLHVEDAGTIAPAVLDAKRMRLQAAHCPHGVIVAKHQRLRLAGLRAKAGAHMVAALLHGDDIDLCARRGEPFRQPGGEGIQPRLVAAGRLVGYQFADHIDHLVVVSVKVSEKGLRVHETPRRG